MRFFLFFFAIAFLVSSCGSDSSESDSTSAEAPKSMFDAFPDLHKKASTMFAELPSAAINEANPTSEAKVLLGYTLYFDNRLSKDGNISCNSCHNLATFGVDNLPKSPGDDGTLGDRNSPTVLNAALHMAQFWDGRSKDVEEQAGEPILNPVEMAMPDEAFVVERLKGIDGYTELFKNAYPDDADPITYQNLENAIGVFERELLTPARFDKYLAGDASALSTEEKKGLQTFLDQSCITCHMGNMFGANMYQKVGIYAKYQEMTGGEVDDLGRFTVTNNEADKYMFKVPSLRNVAKTGPYFHDGAVESLEEAVKIMAKLELNKDLTDEQAKDIATFLGSLTGDIPDKWKSAPEMPM